MRVPHSISVGLLIFALAAGSEIAIRSQNVPSGTGDVIDVKLSWQPQPGVTRYRLQLARDESFSDIVFDRAVSGPRYTVKGIEKGRYFWRVAPAVGETGRFSNPRAVPLSEVGNVSESPVSDAQTPRMHEVDSRGWRAVVGQSLQPILILPSGNLGLNLIATDRNGTVFSFDGLTGEPRWSVTQGSVRVLQNSQATGPAFTILTASDDSRSLLVAGAGYLRLLETGMGRELWRRSLEGTGTAAASVRLDPDGQKAFFVVTASPAKLVLISEQTGAELSSTPLFGMVKGGPVSLSALGEDAVLLSMNGGLVDVRDKSGKQVRSRQLDSEWTDSPVIVGTGGSYVVALATDKGLIALDPTTLNPVWRFETPEDQPAQRLFLVDGQNGDQRVAMIGRTGNLVLVNPRTGKVIWSANIAPGAGSPAVADLDRDGYSDITVIDGSQTVIVFSGRDGATLWSGPSSTGKNGSSGRYFESNHVVAAPDTRSGLPLIFLPDNMGPGLKALGLVTNSERAALN